MRSIRGWLVAALVGAAVFALSWAVQPYDAQVGHAVLGAPGFLKVAGGMALIGSIVIIGPALVVTVGILGWAERWWSAARVAAGVLLPEIVTRVLKVVFHRPRPSYALVPATDFGFPSGHATSAAALAVLAVWFGHSYFQRRRWVALLITVAAGWAAFMALSRLVLGVHSLSDVVAGIGVGVCVSSLVLASSLAAERQPSRRPLRR
ncbi:MAG TPA: phosphatase PAP2 family protein [Candidatus Thermoplasmatota archaeon]|nr:phosphatase PAP2 family protein [Candidatus Thermoplasmatota archaeon]